MEIDEAIATYLLAQSGLTALISRRFFYDAMPQGTPYPAVVGLKISDIKDHTLSGQSKLERPIFQFSAIGQTRPDVKAVARQAKAALQDYQGTMSGIEVQKIELQNEMSTVEKIANTKVYFEDLEFEFNYIRE